MAQDRASATEQHPLASVILMALGLGILARGLHYGWGSLDDPGAGFVPILSGAAMVAFSAITFVRAMVRGWQGLAGLWREARWQRPLVTIVSLVLYSVFLRDLGFLISTFILAAYLYRVLDPSGWKETLIAAALTTLGFYLVFQVWLEVQLPRGLFTF